MSKTFKETLQSQIGNLVEVKLKNDSLKIGLLLNVALPARKMTWHDANRKDFKWGWSAYHCLWNTAPSKQRKLLALSIFSGDLTEVFIVSRVDIKVLGVT